jgi:hypothetical protein
MEARRQSVSLPNDYTQDLAGIQAPVQLSIAILNHVVDWHLVLLNNCGHWPLFEKRAEWAAQVLAFLRATEGPASTSTQHLVIVGGYTC